MKTIYFLLYKEFRQIFRNRAMLPIIFVAPIIQLIVLAYAANFEVKDLKVFWVDKDLSPTTRLLHSKFQGSPYFKMVGTSFSKAEGDLAIERDEADLLVEIPKGFERTLYREDQAKLRLTANAIDGTKGGLATAYASSVIQDLNQMIRSEVNVVPVSVRPKQVSIASANWYNPVMDYKTFMVPGILALLVTMIGTFLSSMNVVREKEIGTIEQLNVTPIKKYHFIIGKLLPFLILALFDLSLGLVVAKILYDLPMLGSLWLLYGFASLYLMGMLGLGLLVSTLTETQQQAMFISWFIMVIFIFLSGMFTAIENMPEWAQQITYLNPVRYFIEVIRMILLKGAVWADLQLQFWAMVIFAVGLNGMAIWRYRKTI